ncbi:MAG: hypothetical protein IPK78_20785 [Rhodospirillales bacterium]|nr:hypothetical protein [Rhodospirillales bacterium]
MQQDLADMSVIDLEMLLVEWKRWRDRVVTVQTMRRRRERFEQASAHIAAIEQELGLRTPEVHERLLREAASRVHTLAAAPTVPLDAFRAARKERAAMQRRKPR